MTARRKVRPGRRKRVAGKRKPDGIRAVQRKRGECIRSADFGAHGVAVAGVSRLAPISGSLGHGRWGLQGARPFSGSGRGRGKAKIRPSRRYAPRSLACRRRGGEGATHGFRWRRGRVRETRETAARSWAYVNAPPALSENPTVLRQITAMSCEASKSSRSGWGFASSNTARRFTPFTNRP